MAIDNDYFSNPSDSPPKRDVLQIDVIKEPLKINEITEQMVSRNLATDHS